MNRCTCWHRSVLQAHHSQPRAALNLLAIVPAENGAENVAADREFSHLSHSFCRSRWIVAATVPAWGTGGHVLMGRWPNLKIESSPAPTFTRIPSFLAVRIAVSHFRGTLAELQSRCHSRRMVFKSPIAAKIP